MIRSCGSDITAALRLGHHHGSAAPVSDLPAVPHAGRPCREAFVTAPSCQCHSTEFLRICRGRIRQPGHACLVPGPHKRCSRNGTNRCNFLPAFQMKRRALISEDCPSRCTTHCGDAWTTFPMPSPSRSSRPRVNSFGALTVPGPARARGRAVVCAPSLSRRRPSLFAPARAGARRPAQRSDAALNPVILAASKPRPAGCDSVLRIPLSPE
jgi:hypothetical protein